MGCAGSKAEGDPNRSTQLAAASRPSGDEDTADDSIPLGPLSKKEIADRIVSDGPHDFPLFRGAHGGFTLRYAAVSQRGYYPEDLYKANQDTFIVTHNFDGIEGDLLLGVFDGHGGDGDLCSRFTRKHLPDQLSFALKATTHKTVSEALTTAYVKTNRLLHDFEGCDSEVSGTTAVVALFRGGVLHAANAGDSRIVLGERRGQRIVACPLSSDQTPHRKDERERCKAAGAAVRTSRMVEGRRDFSLAWEEALGTNEQADDEGDPPRLFARSAHAQGVENGPGCAFTRSIGDGAGEAIGVCAEPELVNKELREQDQFVCLASDGVWEFITSQEVVDKVVRFESPLEACRAIVAESYRRWLQFDVRTDDITIILGWLDSDEGGAAPREASDEEIRRYEELRKAGLRTSTVTELEREGFSLGLSVVGLGADEARPARKGLSAEMREKIELGSVRVDDDDELIDWVPPNHPKTDQERTRIHAAVQANEFFDHLTDQQREDVYGCMVRQTVALGDVVIRQGEQGNCT